jgi:hypothetical protein
LQIPVKPFASCRFRIVEISDPFNLGAPVFDIAGEAVFLCTRTNELALGALLVGIEIPCRLCFQPRYFEAALNQVSGSESVPV